MSITFVPRYIDYQKTEPDISFFITQTVIPIRSVSNSKWTLSGITIHADGYLDAVDVAQDSYAERYIPGIIEGHLYKVTIVTGGGDAIDITMGGLTLETGATAGTHIYYVRPADGNPLKFNYPGVPAASFTIESVIVEALDPINPDLIPVTG